MAPKRAPNRLLVLCASINDVTAWPFWKFLQMKKIRGVTDMALLAFNSDGGSFEARIDGEKYHLKNYAKVRGYQHDMFEAFVHRWHDPGRSYFVYGGHGMGDYVELEQSRVSLQAHELAAVFGRRTFEAILFDACFMANLDCAYHLRHNTRYIGACEGYMWEPDTALDCHIFNTHNASAMSRFKDPLHTLHTIQADYCSKALRGDFSVIDTTHVAELRRFVQEHVIQRVYDRATFYSLPQQERLQQLAEAALQAAIAEYGHPGGDMNMMPSTGNRQGRPRTAPAAPGSLALSAAARPTRKQRLLQAIQFEHSLYPSEVEDKQLLDLKSYLLDMAQEEQQRKAWEAAAMGPQRRIAAGRRRVRSDALLSGSIGGVGAGASSPSVSAAHLSTFAVFKPKPSRALFVDRHGRLPPAAPTVAMTDTAAASQAGAFGSAVPSAAAITTTAPTLTSTSPGYKGSAQEGLDLFNQVVVSHVQPKAAAIYAAQLGGLSFTAHEYSAMSRPVEPWHVGSKRLLKRRSKMFIKNGELAEVEMEKPRLLTSMANSKLLAAADHATVTCAAAAAAGGPSTTLRPIKLTGSAPQLSVPSSAPSASASPSTSSSSSLDSRDSSYRSSRASSGVTSSTKSLLSLPAVSSQGHRAASYPPSPNSRKQTNNC
ncbi:PUF nine target 1 [Leptomonas seymouri]|uniref:PUF nine target 1 n=1 Tax=Leptomonas seymouri TaxID=5684 RepID=A0A0N1I0Q1_LEPSE|nr:PUF nine target 1 [Leptomonas seymouri]|eukprot:KPI83588.1 PUF nine target 1 [Leptomonas seymouri]